MRRFLVPLLLTLSFISTQAFARLNIVITEGMNSARSVAVIPFKWTGPGKKPFNIADVVAADLRSSGKFSPITENKMPNTPSNSQHINYEMWHNMGVEAIVMGEIKPAKKAGKYSITYELLDVVRGNMGMEEYSPTLLKRRSSASKRQARHFSHRISNIVYEKLTGERGAFLTKIAYVAVQRKHSKPYQLRISDYDGYGEKTILRSREPIMSPSWSPDARKLAYVSFENKRSQIFISIVYTGKRQNMPT